MSTISPAPFPAAGARKLSPVETMRRASALACTLPQSSLSTCSGQLFVGMFFDGTGNNMSADFQALPYDERKHTNIVKLFQAHRYEPSRGYFSFYMPGVGTPFPDIGDTNKYTWKNWGSIAAERGEHRIIWAFTQLLNAPHRYVFGDAPLIPPPLAKTITNNLAATLELSLTRRLVLGAWQKKLRDSLEGRKPTVEQINVSVFGFSRGAAEARAFVNWLFEVCDNSAGNWSFAGVPIRCQFLGLFDTVASVGLANLYDNGILNGHQSWADDNLQIHPAVEQCVHFVAGHEVRACFPSDSVRVNNVYPNNALEVMYPGAHSDVGGGYAPNSLGVSKTQDSVLAIIPGVSMYREARKAGVPLLAWDLLSEATQRSLTPSTTTINDFNNYLASAKIGAGPVEEMGRRNMALYLSYRFKHLNSFDYYRTSPYSQSSKIDKSYLYTTQRSLFLQLSRLRQVLVTHEPEFAKSWLFDKKYGHIIDAASRSWDELRAAPSAVDRYLDAAWMYVGPGGILSLIKAPYANAQEKNAFRYAFEVAQRIDLESVTPEVEAFFDKYVHDSEAGFMAMGMDEYSFNGIGITKFRTVYKGNG